MKTIVALAFVSLTTVLTGCSGSPDVEDQDTTAEGEEALTATQRQAFAGSWNNDVKEHDELPFFSYTFKTDGTYSARGGCRPGPTGPHCFAIMTQSGTWKATKTTKAAHGAPKGTPELVLTPSFGQKETFFYTMKNDKLSLKRAFTDQASIFDHDVETLAPLEIQDLCADKDNNSLGVCPEDFPCLFQGPTGHEQRCSPQI